MAWNVPGRTDELQHDFRLWCSEVASTNAQVLQQVSRKLRMPPENYSRQEVADEMLDQLNDIKEVVLSRPQDVPDNGARMEDHPSTMKYKGKRYRAKKIIYNNRQSLKQMGPIAESQLCPPVYARYDNVWQCTTFADTWKSGRTRITDHLPEWILNSDHEIVSFLRSEPEVFGLEGHLVATNALYVIAVEMPELPTGVEECRSEGEAQQDGGEEPGEDERSNNEEPCDRDEETRDTEYESSDEDDDEDIDEEENEKKKIKTDQEQFHDEDENSQDDERPNSAEQVGQFPAENTEFCGTEPNGNDESDDEKDENEHEGTDKHSQEISVHYYAGQTLRNVVRRCEGHCRNVKLLLDEATKDTYSTFEDYECAANMKKVMLVDAYLAAAKAVAIAHPPATYRCAVIVVRHFVDRKAELIRRFGLTDMKQGLNGGKSIQTKITDYFILTADPQDDFGYADDTKTEDIKTKDTVMES